MDREAVLPSSPLLLTHCSTMSTRGPVPRAAQETRQAELAEPERKQVLLAAGALTAMRPELLLLPELGGGGLLYSRERSSFSSLSESSSSSSSSSLSESLLLLLLLLSVRLMVPGASTAEPPHSSLS